MDIIIITVFEFFLIAIFGYLFFRFKKASKTDESRFMTYLAWGSAWFMSAFILPSITIFVGVLLVGEAAGDEFSIYFTDIPYYLPLVIGAILNLIGVNNFLKLKNV